MGGSTKSRRFQKAQDLDYNLAASKQESKHFLPKIAYALEFAAYVCPKMKYMTLGPKF